MLTDTICSVNNFSKAFGDFYACSDISFSIKKNSVTGILGLNGAGKTTLLKSICGLYVPTSGQIEVCGFSAVEELKKNVSYAGSSDSLENNLTVFETLYFNCVLHGFSKNLIEKKIIDSLNSFNLSEEKGTKVRNLSRGFSQRLILACAVLSEPKLIVLDEFSSGLDPVQTVEIKKLILKISKKIPVIFSTHRIDEAEDLCSEIIILNRGKISVNDTVENLKSKNSLENIFMEATADRRF